MLQKEFFQVQPFNPNPYWENTVLINLSQSSKYDADTIFPAGRYKVSIAPGLDSYSLSKKGNSSITTDWWTCVLTKTETITQPFIIRAYCGGDASNNTTGGINPYSGRFKINATDARILGNRMPPGADVNHIFGTDGGNGRFHIRFAGVDYWTYLGGGGNCLGNGNVSVYRTDSGALCASGAGSCLHFIPVGGVFGRDYIRAYHITAAATKQPVNQAEWEAYNKNRCGGGSAYGGASTPSIQTNNVESSFSRGGSSPYGSGGLFIDEAGTGVGHGEPANAAHAYFNGTSWTESEDNYIRTVTNGSLAPHSYIKVTYLGMLN